MSLAVLLRGLALRWLARHRVRSALAGLAVALGVAAFLGSAAVADSIARSARAAIGNLAGGVDLSVEAAETGLDRRLATRVASVPGVRAAAPRIVGWLRAPDAVGPRILVVGVDPLLEREFAACLGQAEPVVDDAAAFALGRGAIVGEGLARALGAAGVSGLRLQGARGAVDFAVVGRLGDAPVTRTARGRVAVVALPAAQGLLGKPGRVDRIDVLLAEGASADDVARDLRDLAELESTAGLYVGPPRLRDGSAEDAMSTVNVAMQVGAVIALLVGVFLIFHTVAVGVAERRREVGVLRALGATRRQVRIVFVGEALLLGLAGSLVGVLLAWALARGVLSGFAATISGAYFGTEPPEVSIPPWLAAAGVGVGVLVAVTAAWLPARQAAAQTPTDSIRRGPGGGARDAPLWRRLLAALLLAVAGVVLVVWPTLLGSGTGYVALLSLLGAFLAASPVLLERAARLAAPLFARSLGVPARLAADDLARHPRRAALPAAVLAFGLALVIETAGTLESLSEETVAWMEENIAGELFVASGRSVMGGAGHTPLAADLGSALHDVPGVDRVVGVRFLRAPWRDTRIFLLGLDMDEYAPVWRLRIRGAELPEVIAGLSAGTGCVVSENFVLLHDVEIGERIQLPGAGAGSGVEVLATFRDYSWPRGTVLIDRGLLAERLDDHLADEFALTLLPGADPDDVAAAVEAAVGAGRELVVHSAVELQQEARSLLRDIFSLAYAQVAVALAVAFLGVLNTLWISIVLRRRELGLLRSVGATRGQLVTSIVAEAALLGLIGAVFGVIGGAIVEWVFLYRILPADTGWVYPMRFPWTTAAVVALLGALTSAAAGWLPARSAARTPLSDALAYE